MKQEPCKYADLGCTQLISFIDMPSTKRMPVHAEPTRRLTADLLPKGIYYTEEGTRYTHETAPLNVDVYLSHWGNCPGAEKARKK